MNKIEEKFTKNPKELKYKCEIINCENILNISFGYDNDEFDIYTSYKDKNPYIVLVNKYNKSVLDIYSLFTKQKITVLRGNKEEIKKVKYFINKNNNKEYFITKGRHKNVNFGVVLVWDISNNYKIILRAEPEHGYGASGTDDIACLLIFPHYMEDFFMVTSTSNKCSEHYDCTEIYSIKKQKLIEKIEDSNNLSINFLLSWYNKNNDNYYFIQFHQYGFDIYNLLKKEICFEQGLYIDNHREKQEREFNNGFIYTKDDTADDYLCFFTEANYLNFFNLNKKKYIKSLKLEQQYNIFDKKFYSFHQMIQWNKYFLFYELKTKVIKIFDLENEQ